MNFNQHSEKFISMLDEEASEYSENYNDCSPLSPSKKKFKIKKRMFSEEEDMIIRLKVQEYGTKRWKDVVKFLPFRTPRQVRERWNNYLDPKVVNKNWTESEDELLKHLFSVYGSKWAFIATHFEGRTYINVKNRMALLRRKEARNVTSPTSLAKDKEIIAQTDKVQEQDMKKRLDLIIFDQAALMDQSDKNEIDIWNMETNESLSFPFIPL